METDVTGEAACVQELRLVERKFLQLRSFTALLLVSNLH